MDKKPKLSELEQDLLGELFNLGVGRAANSLSKMVNQEVKLSVPYVKFVSYQEMGEYLGNDTQICAVGQKMHGPFDAQSLLLFPEKSSMEVVRKMLGEHLSDELIAEMQQEALTEIGNIVLNACIGAISNSMNKTITVELPHFFLDSPEHLIRGYLTSDDEIVLLITIDMILSQSEIKGYMAFILGPFSMQKLQQSLQEILSGIM